MQIDILTLSGYSGEFVGCQRVVYGTKAKDRKLREYRVSPSSPVGSMLDWVDFAKQQGKQGVVFEDAVENERIIIKFSEPKDEVVCLNHKDKSVVKTTIDKF